MSCRYKFPCLCLHIYESIVTGEGDDVHMRKARMKEVNHKQLNATEVKPIQDPLWGVITLGSHILLGEVESIGVQGIKFHQPRQSKIINTETKGRVTINEIE